MRNFFLLLALCSIVTTGLASESVNTSDQNRSIQAPLRGIEVGTNLLFVRPSPLVVGAVAAAFIISTNFANLDNLNPGFVSSGSGYPKLALLPGN